MEKGKQAMPLVPLVKERLHRHWSQQEVADRLGTTAGNVSRWERGITFPGPYFRQKLCEIFEKSTEELGLYALPSVPEEKGDSDLSQTIISPEETVSRVSFSQQPVPDIAPPQRPSRLGSLFRHKALRLFAIALLLSTILTGITFLVLLHAHSLAPLLARSTSSHQTTATPVPPWRSWPQALNDTLQATDYNQDWQVDPVPPDTINACTFSSLSHTYQNISQGLSYCNFGNSEAHPWTTLAYSIDLSIRQGNQGGPVIRLRQGNYYYFFLTITGTYELMLHQNINGGQDSRVARGFSAAIHQGLDQWNTLLVYAQGSSFQLWINGQYVTTAIDRTLSQGTIGVAVSYGVSMQVTQVWFRHAQVWLPTGLNDGH